MYYWFFIFIPLDEMNDFAFGGGKRDIRIYVATFATNETKEFFGWRFCLGIFRN